MNDTLLSLRFRLMTCFMRLYNAKKPFLILLISLVQITIYYGEILPMYYLQRDTLRRFEIWRLVTSSLVHSKTTGTIPDEHLWSNVIVQLYFGWKLEERLGFRYTLLLYTTSTISGGLITSARRACRVPAVGASGAVCGLVAAHLSKYALTGQWFSNHISGSVCIVIGFEILAAVFQVFQVPDVIIPKNYSATAHLGGALGGFIMGVFLWNKVLQNSASPSQLRNNIVKFVSVFAVVFCLAVGGRYSYFAYILSPNTAIRQKFRDALFEQGPRVYDGFSFQLCKAYWRSYNQGNQTLFNSLRDIVQLDNISYLDYIQEFVRS